MNRTLIFASALCVLAFSLWLYFDLAPQTNSQVVELQDTAREARVQDEADAGVEATNQAAAAQREEIADAAIAVDQTADAAAKSDDHALPAILVKVVDENGTPVAGATVLSMPDAAIRQNQHISRDHTWAWLETSSQPRQRKQTESDGIVRLPDTWENDTVVLGAMFGERLGWREMTVEQRAAALRESGPIVIQIQPVPSLRVQTIYPDGSAAIGVGVSMGKLKRESDAQGLCTFPTDDSAFVRTTALQGKLEWQVAARNVIALQVTESHLQAGRVEQVIPFTGRLQVEFQNPESGRALQHMICGLCVDIAADDEGPPAYLQWLALEGVQHQSTVKQLVEFPHVEIGLDWDFGYPIGDPDTVPSLERLAGPQLKGEVVKHQLTAPRASQSRKHVVRVLHADGSVFADKDIGYQVGSLTEYLATDSDGQFELRTTIEGDTLELSIETDEHIPPMTWSGTLSQAAAEAQDQVHEIRLQALPLVLAADVVNENGQAYTDPYRTTLLWADGPQQGQEVAASDHAADYTQILYYGTVRESAGLLLVVETGALPWKTELPCQLGQQGLTVTLPEAKWLKFVMPQRSAEQLAAVSLRLRDPESGQVQQLDPPRLWARTHLAVQQKLNFELVDRFGQVLHAQTSALDASSTEEQAQVIEFAASSENDYELVVVTSSGERPQRVELTWTNSLGEAQATSCMQSGSIRIYTQRMPNDLSVALPSQTQPIPIQWEGRKARVTLP